MQEESLQKVLDTLNELKKTMHDDANVSVNQQLDEAICLIQDCMENGDANANDKVLSAIGKVLAALPSISRLLEMFLE